MPRLAGLVIDQYDDVDGRVLRSVHPDPSDIPDFVKESARLDEGALEKLADDRFAVVLVNEGRKMKKYAMVDKGNTALSIVYLLKQAHLLPREAVKVAAANLIEACRHYGLGVPEELIKTAKDGSSPVSGKSQKPYSAGAKIIHLNFTGKEHASAPTDQAQLGKHDGALADVNQRTNVNGVQGTNFMSFPAITEKEKTKEAAAAGTEFRTREQGFRYVDATGWDPEAFEATDRAAPSQTLLDGRYPVDSMDQVKTASIYFEENWKQFYPRDRRAYCVKLAARMTELGLDVPDDIARYGAPGYAADVDSHVESRRALVNEEFYPALNTLLEKRAQVSPGTFAEALAEFDNISNVRWLWDAQVCDPWMSTFGPSLEKVAEEEWTFSSHGIRIHEEDLEELARNGLSVVKKQFGHDLAQGFAKKPKTVFESLPTPNKLVLARLAMARHDGTATG